LAYLALQKNQERINTNNTEKKENKSYETTGGYLKEISLKEACVEWWKDLNEDDKKVIMGIPNFDAEKFEMITKIKVENL
jgi:hypothetical protein